MLTQEKLKEILHYCPATGVFTWRVNRGKVNIGKIAGYNSFHEKSKKTYVLIGFQRKMYGAHRLAFLYMTGDMPELVDHEDGDGTNNKWSNLKTATPLSNARNTRRKTTNKSGHTGISFCKRTNKHIVRIGSGTSGKKINIGYFSNIDDAIKARKAAEVQYGFHANHGQERPL